jgi:hypothetical protein
MGGARLGSKWIEARQASLGKRNQFGRLAMDVTLQGLMLVIGPILLAAAILWAVLNNRGTPAEVQRTEDATRAMYDAQDIDDKVRDSQ